MLDKVLWTFAILFATAVAWLVYDWRAVVLPVILVPVVWGGEF